MKNCLLALALTLGATPASAQVDFTGTWGPRLHEDQPERIPGPELGDYLGLPITDGARRFAESWDPSRITLPEQQCRVHVSPYIYRGPLQLRISELRDPDTQELIAIVHRISTYDQERTIYMDGRPHPDELAPHTWMGFSTGRWDGDRLVVRTTHIKQGWHRRNGLPMSDKAELTEHFARVDDDVFTRISVLHDPVYLTEPLVKSEEFVRNPRGLQPLLYQCKPVVEVATQVKGEVPHYLPGENPFLHEFRDRHRIPEIGTRGGAETMYPDFAERLKARPAAAPALGGGPDASAQAGRQGRQGPRRPAAAAGADVSSAGIKIRKVQGNVYLLASEVGGNTTVQIGDTGVLVVDPGVPQLHDELLSAIRTLSPKAIHYILNTHVHEDHAGGNQLLAAAGPQRLNADPLTAGIGGNTGGATTIVAHENVYHRMSADGPDNKPGAAWPNDTFFNELREVYFNDDGIQVFHIPSAHTDGDSIVYFRRSDVIATGDLFTTTMYPYIDVARGGHVNGIINGLNKILDLALPNLTVQEGGTMIVPGHGRICDEQDVIEYRDMLTIVRDRIEAMVDRKMTLEQVQAARPTLDWDARYGTDTGFWTTSAFVEAVYRNLSEPANGTR